MYTRLTIFYVLLCYFVACSRRLLLKLKQKRTGLAMFYKAGKADIAGRRAAVRADTFKELLRVSYIFVIAAALINVGGIFALSGTKCMGCLH